VIDQVPMRSFRIGAFACSCACALATAPVQAEPIRIGARAGFTTAWLSEASSPIIGATAAFLTSIPVASGGLFLEPELAFSMKGGAWNGLDSGGEEKHYDYVEVPLILRYGPPPGFFVGVGVVPAVLVHEWRSSHGDISGSKARRFDLSALAELGGIWQHFRFDLRLEVGLVEADETNSAAPPASRTRALSFSVGWLL